MTIRRTALDLALMDDPPPFADKLAARQEAGDLRANYAQALEYIATLVADRQGLCVGGESPAHDPSLPPVKDGVCLELFHGRQDPRAEMDDWGDPGPVFGPYTGIQTTYAEDIKLVCDGDNYGRLIIVDGLVHYNGLYYGDWTVLNEARVLHSPDLLARLQAFEQELATGSDETRFKSWVSVFLNHVRSLHHHRHIDRLLLNACELLDEESMGVTFSDGPDRRVVHVPVSWAEWRTRALRDEFKTAFLTMRGVGPMKYQKFLDGLRNEERLEELDRAQAVPPARQPVTDSVGNAVAVRTTAARVWDDANLQVFTDAGVQPDKGGYWVEARVWVSADEVAGATPALTDLMHHG